VSIVNNADGFSQSLTVNDSSVLEHDLLRLALHVEYSDSEVIVGLSNCSGTSYLCMLPHPFWIVLQERGLPIVKHATGMSISPNAGAIWADRAGIHVPLGIWDGQDRTLTITGTEEFVATSVAAVTEALSSADCSPVIDSMEICAESTNCSSFETSSAEFSEAHMHAINVLFHQTTGFNADNFAALCISACKFGVTPSMKYTEREVCSGASQGQWGHDDLAWMQWAREYESGSVE
jgi:hypothetical protein